MIPQYEHNSTRNKWIRDKSLWHVKSKWVNMTRLVYYICAGVVNLNDIDKKSVIA